MRRAQMQQFHQQMKEVVEKAQAIANNHLATLDNIHSQLEPSHEQWKTDIANLRQAQRQSHIQSQNQAPPQEQTQSQGQGQSSQWAAHGQMKPGMHGEGMEHFFDGKY